MVSEITNAKIINVLLSNEYCGCLTACITVDRGGFQQDFGGYTLYIPERGFDPKQKADVTGHFIWRVLKIADASDWSELVGKLIRVKIEDGSISSIGHFLKDDWFCPKIDFAENL
jgi:hypothetical protein